MGVIKDGTISGYLPSTSTFAVHLPGYPSSLSRAVEVLGGIEGIQKVQNEVHLFLWYICSVLDSTLLVA